MHWNSLRSCSQKFQCRIKASVQTHRYKAIMPIIMIMDAKWNIVVDTCMRDISQPIIIRTAIYRIRGKVWQKSCFLLGIGGLVPFLPAVQVEFLFSVIAGQVIVKPLLWYCKFSTTHSIHCSSQTTTIHLHSCKISGIYSVSEWC